MMVPGPPRFGLSVRGLDDAPYIYVYQYASSPRVSVAYLEYINGFAQHYMKEHPFVVFPTVRYLDTLLAAIDQHTLIQLALGRLYYLSNSLDDFVFCPERPNYVAAHSKCAHPKVGGDGEAYPAFFVSALLGSKTEHQLMMRFTSQVPDRLLTLVEPVLAGAGSVMKKHSPGLAELTATTVVANYLKGIVNTGRLFKRHCCSTWDLLDTTPDGLYGI